MRFQYPPLKNGLESAVVWTRHYHNTDPQKNPSEKRGTLTSMTLTTEQLLFSCVTIMKIMHCTKESYRKADHGRLRDSHPIENLQHTCPSSTHTRRSAASAQPVGPRFKPRTRNSKNQAAKTPKSPSKKSIEKKVIFTKFAMEAP